MVRDLKVAMDGLREEWKSYGIERSDDTFSWGMLESCRVMVRNNHDGEFVIVTDEARLRFSYVLRHGKPYFTHVKVTL